MICAIVFDFDGLILETEEPTFLSWQAVYRSFGHSLSFSTFSSMVGTTKGDFDPRAHLEQLVKEPIDWERVERGRQAMEYGLIEAQPVLPGAEQYLRDARRLGLKVGLASNSPLSWVKGHLTRIGLVDCFDFMSTSERAQHLKPHPELYLSALCGLGVSADEAFALEDSPLGIRSAQLAGLFCVVVPNDLTRRLDISRADLEMSSLLELPLEELLDRVMALKTRRAAC